MATNNYIPLFVLFKNHSPSGDSYEISVSDYYRIKAINYKGYIKIEKLFS